MMINGPEHFLRNPLLQLNPMEVSVNQQSNLQLLHEQTTTILPLIRTAPHVNVYL